MDIEKKVKQDLSKLKINKKDKILVALSGGKDSSVVAFLLKKFGYTIEGFHINLGMGKYSEECLNCIKELCKIIDIPLHIYDIKNEMGSSMCYIRSSVQSRQSLKNCAICGVIKKWILNKEGRKLKAKYIATGHHLDDEIQTFLLNLFKGSPQLSANTGIVTKNISDKKFIPRIKPLFYVFEDDIKKYSQNKKLPVNYNKCPCAIDSYRIQIRDFIKKLPKKNKENIMENFDEMSILLEKKKDLNIGYCEICGEPSRRKICKMCDLLQKNV